MAQISKTELEIEVRRQLARLKKLSRWYKPGKLWGIPIHIHSSTALLVIAFLIAHRPWGIASLSIGLILHEFAHIWMARSFDMKTRRIQITAMGATAEFDHDAFEKIFDHGDVELKSAAVGPLMSALLASVGYILATLFLILHLPSVSAVFAEFALINTFIGCFNMLPIFPLDGGRVLRGYLHQHHFKTLKEKEALNRIFIKLPYSVKMTALGIFGGGILTQILTGVNAPTIVPGAILYIMAKSLDQEAKNTEQYIDFIKRKLSFVPDIGYRYLDRSWWSELGLRSAPSRFAEVKRAYRKRVLEVHPDKGGNNDAMQSTVRAYEIAKRKFGVV